MIADPFIVGWIGGAIFYGLFVILNLRKIFMSYPTYDQEPKLPFQARVRSWIEACFGRTIGDDAVERNYRFFEESTETVQSLGMSREDCHSIVNYVFDRKIGDPYQEVGGVMVTLAALCAANGISMNQEGEAELARISTPEMMEKIRKKQAEKPRLLRGGD